MKYISKDCSSLMPKTGSTVTFAYLYMICMYIFVFFELYYWLESKVNRTVDLLVDVGLMRALGQYAIQNTSGIEC